MTMKQTIEAFEILDNAYVNGEGVLEEFRKRGINTVHTEPMGNDKGSTDLVVVRIPGKNGKMNGGTAPTLYIMGSPAGVGGRPETAGIVSDADGALVAIASGLKIADMRQKGDILEGDVIIGTNICTNAPTVPHDPVPFMGSWVGTYEIKKKILDFSADAVIITETTKGNRVINHCGFAITPTIKEGWILRISPAAIEIMERVTGKAAVTVPITMQDITPPKNGVHHVNALGVLPEGAVMPSMGVAITTEMPVSGAVSGVTNVVSLEPAVRFCVEVAKDFGRGCLKFYDEQEFARLVHLYGKMDQLQTMGKS